MKVLIIQQKMIGDVLVSSLLCEHLKQQLPECEVHYLINEHTLAVVAHNPFIDKIILFRKEERQNKLKFYSFLRSISKEKYDVVIDAYGKLESNLITLFSKAEKKIAYPKWHTKFLYTHHIPIKSRQPDSTSTTIDDRLALLSPLISETLDLNMRPQIYLTASEKDEARNFLSGHGIDLSNRLIMLSILGSGESKTYPLKYMAELIDKIAQNTDATLLFNYIPSQEKEAKAVYAFCSTSTRKKVALDAFASDLRGFLALLYHCNCLIGNEGGSTNMAKSLGVPTFAIFAPWIDKIGWHTYADEKNVAVHVEDFFEVDVKKLSLKEIKKNSSEFYQKFKPSLFEDKLIRFLSNEVGSDK